MKTKMKMKNYLLILSLLAISFTTKAQDTLVYNDGKIVLCKVNKVDSFNVYIDRGSFFENLYSSVKRSEIKEIRYYRSSRSRNRNSDFTQYNCIELSAGKSFAVGAFGNDDTNASESGLAGNGFNINGEFSHYFKRFFGISAKVYYNNNEFKTDKLAGLLTNQANLKFTGETANYGSYGLLVGPTFNFQLNGISLNGHIMYGYGQLTEPEATFTITSGTNTAWVKMSEISSGAVMSAIGGGLVFDLNDSWVFFVNADYLSGSFNFNKYTLSSNIAPSEDDERGTQPFGVINLTFGVGIKF